MNKFYLQVQKVENKCLFQLAWNNNQKITAELPYPENIISLYYEWRRAYHKFYSTQLRGKVINLGTVAPAPVDWQAQLVQAEAKLLYEFHQWLRSKELYDIRSILTANNLNNQEKNTILHNHNILVYQDIFISCNSLELIRLPWEEWEIGSQLSNPKVRIARQPLNINRSIKKIKRAPGKVRILAIFGDNTGLNFQKEKQAIDSLKKVIEVVQLDWQEGKDIQRFKSEIVNNLTASKGWDILFFAGHSQETDLTGGQISIAPNATILLSEIEQPLTTATANGLQFAVFNSCDGLSIANKLIDLGLSQVAVMREQVHNRVAEEIFVQFLTSIAQHHDVHQALLTACDYLKLEKNLTYPSANLIPSLFRHPDAEVFQLKPFGISTVLKQWLPSRRELITLGILSALSILPPVQESVLDWQIGMQAVYRHATNQIPNTQSQPPVLVVSVDEKSLNEANVNAEKFHPIDRSYLAKIIDKLTAQNATVIGIDYLLDRATDEDKILANSIQNSINQNSTLFIFSAILNPNNQEQGIRKSVANLNQSLQGYVDKLPGHLALLDKGSDCFKTCPFSYLIALTHLLVQESSPFPVHNHNDLRANLIHTINKQKNQHSTQRLHQLRIPELTSFSIALEQAWLYPIIDYSLPPNYVYQFVSAHDILQTNNVTNINPKQQVILIGAGGYEDAGLSQVHSDNSPLPLGLAYWRRQNAANNSLTQITGVEINAYMVQHLLKQHLIIPIPDLWMIGIIAIIAKGTLLSLVRFPNPKHTQVFLLISLLSGTGAYILMSVQMYISASIIFPVFIPITLFWSYLLPELRKKE